MIMVTRRPETTTRAAAPRTRSQNQNVVKGLKPMLTRLTRFKILVSSLCVVFAGAFS